MAASTRPARPLPCRLFPRRRPLRRRLRSLDKPREGPPQALLAVGHVREHVPRERAELAEDEGEGEQLDLEVEDGDQRAEERRHVDERRHAVHAQQPHTASHAMPRSHLSPAASSHAQPHTSSGQESRAPHRHGRRARVAPTVGRAPSLGRKHVAALLRRADKEGRRTDREQVAKRVLERKGRGVAEQLCGDGRGEELMRREANLRDATCVNARAARCDVRKRCGSAMR
eukprot:2129130-Prymnesium_polylepis.2